MRGGRGPTISRKRPYDRRRSELPHLFREADTDTSRIARAAGNFADTSQIAPAGDLDETPAWGPHETPAWGPALITESILVVNAFSVYWR